MSWKHVREREGVHVQWCWAGEALLPGWLETSGYRTAWLVGCTVSTTPTLVCLICKNTTIRHRLLLSSPSIIPRLGSLFVSIKLLLTATLPVFSFVCSAMQCKPPEEKPLDRQVPYSKYPLTHATSLRSFTCVFFFFLIYWTRFWKRATFKS
jgi:hypothetical protein